MIRVLDRVILLADVEGAALQEAIREAGAARFRAILLTSLTTFAGLTPLLMEQSVQAKLLIPMGISLAFGVIFATLITLVMVKNLPGVIEILLKRRTTLDGGARFAFSTLVRYSITIIGTIVVFGLLGITWGKVQWLAAALTFGLGFGLQEIVANFVSGLILLIERPVRVGDVVTIGTLMGKVSRI